MEQCLLDRNISQIHISGDSLTREHFQNVISLLTHDGGAMRKVLLTMSFLIHLSTGTVLSIIFDPDDGMPRSNDTWHLWDVQLMHALSTGNPTRMSNIVRSRFEMNRNRDRVSNVSNAWSVFYNHPQIQREDPRVLRDKFPRESSARASQFSFMTPPRQKIRADEMMAAAQELGLSILDGQVNNFVPYVMYDTGVFNTFSFLLSR